MKHVHYIDQDTRIRYRFAASLLGYGHVLERRRKWWIFTWWSERSQMYDNIISGTDRLEHLVEWLLWDEAQKQRADRGFAGYPEGGN